jgi:bacillithiol system protein YtxJ
MNWIALTSMEQLHAIKNDHTGKISAIFKHSTRCSISTMALSRLERSTAPDSIDFYYLDLLQYRSISNEIASIFEEEHASPQMLLIKNGSCFYNETHGIIMMEDIIEATH